MVMVVPARSPIKSVAAFIDYARTKTLSFGAGNSSSRVAGEQFKQMTGVEMTYVPYKGNPQAVTDLIGGWSTSWMTKASSDPRWRGCYVLAGSCRRPSTAPSPSRPPSTPRQLPRRLYGLSAHRACCWICAWAA
jgi:tripartite-type tricarboxylate transporter receptor subunit TctC